MARVVRKSRRKRRPFRGAFGFFVFALLIVALLAIGIGAGFVTAAVRKLPSLSSFEPTPNVTSMIYDHKGELLAKLHALENRTPVGIEVIPERLQDAFIIMEDTRFYEHRGVNPLAILRALYVNLRGGSIQGASTITQQLVRTALLKSTQRTYTRKIQEAILSIQVERRFTKKEIFEMYLNQIPLGHGAYGVEAAAQTYFGKSVSDLTLGECALLVGITPAPSTFSPYNDLEKAQSRRNLVLDKMLEHGSITESEAQEAREEPINLVGLKEEVEWGVAPHFLDYVLRHLLDRYGQEMVYNGGLKVYTTIDMQAQEAAQRALSEVLDAKYPLDADDPLRAAAVILDPSTGHIKAMVARTYKGRLGHIDAVDALRQPGSAFKPIAAYAAALEMGYGTGTVLDDAPMFTSGRVWPENYDRTFRGLMTIRRGIELSINVLAVKTLDAVGVAKGVEYTERLGITSLITDGSLPRNDYTRSLALGGLTNGVSSLEMAAAFGAFGNKGVYVKPVAILKVVDQYGNVLEEAQSEHRVAVSEQTAYLMTHMLKGVITTPGATGTRANIGRPAAGKTGTSSDYADAWFAGYTPDLSGAVWMGFSERKPMDRVVGGQYPASIWASMMRAAHKNLPVRDFDAPGGLVRVAVCTKSGLRPGDECPEETISTGLFVQGTEPELTCDVHVSALVCAENPSELATQGCPETIVKSFIKRKVPYSPAGGRIPLDAAEELPTEFCSIHGGHSKPPPGYEDEEGDEEYEEDEHDNETGKDKDKGKKGKDKKKDNGQDILY